MLLSMRGVGPGVLTAYLLEMGGREAGPGQIVGNGWEAHLAAGEPVCVGAIRLGVTDVQFVGDEATLEVLRREFEKKTMRAGG